MEKAGFRGLIASASLKRTNGSVSGFTWPKRFRGLIASASLKLGYLWHKTTYDVKIPRLDCLGLIEAGSRAGGTSGVTGDSEA